MDKISITLTIKKKKKTYFLPSELNAKTAMIAMEIKEETDLVNPGVSDVNRMAEFIVSAYGNQFTKDQLLEGTPYKEFMGIMINQIRVLSGQLNNIAKNITPEGKS